jgi:hypothetical protein
MSNQDPWPAFVLLSSAALTSHTQPSPGLVTGLLWVPGSVLLSSPILSHVAPVFLLQCTWDHGVHITSHHGQCHLQDRC